MARILNKEVREKVKFAAEQIANGNSKRIVVEKLVDKFDTTSQKANYYYNRALQDLKEVDERHSERCRAAQRERLETIISGAIERRHYAAATKAIEVMNRMLGINEPDKKEVAIKDSVIKFNFENDINKDDNETIEE